MRKRPKSPSSLVHQRLRFGRNDPMMTQQQLFVNENLIFEDDSSIESQKIQRAPIVRFRFGKRDSEIDSGEKEVS